MIDLLLANVCKQNVTRFPYEIARLAEDIAGGIVVTAPSEADLKISGDRAVCRKISESCQGGFRRKPAADSSAH